MAITSGKFLEKFTDDELLEITRSLSDEIDQKVEAFNNCKEQLEKRGWQFVNWPEYVKAE